MQQFEGNEADGGKVFPPRNDKFKIKRDFPKVFHNLCVNPRGHVKRNHRQILGQQVGWQAQGAHVRGNKQVYLVDEFGNEVVQVRPARAFQKVPDLVPAQQDAVLVQILLGHLHGHPPPHLGQSRKNGAESRGAAVPMDGSLSSLHTTVGHVIGHHQGLVIADDHVLVIPVKLGRPVLLGLGGEEEGNVGFIPDRIHFYF